MLRPGVELWGHNRPRFDENWNRDGVSSAPGHFLHYDEDGPHFRGGSNDVIHLELCCNSPLILFLLTSDCVICCAQGAANGCPDPSRSAFTVRLLTPVPCRHPMYTALVYLSDVGGLSIILNQTRTRSELKINSKN